MPNKMNKWILGSFLLTLPMTTMIGQTIDMTKYGIQQNVGQMGSQSVLSVIRDFNLGSKSVKGTPYWRNEWLEGSIIWLNGTRLDKVPMKVLTYKTTALSAKIPSGDSIIVPIKNYKVAILLDPMTKDSIFFKRILHDETPNGELMRVIHDGDFAILARQIGNMIPASNTGAYNAGREYDEFMQKTEYFLLKKGSGKLEKIKLSKKGLFEVLPGKDAELSTFIKSNQLNVDKEKDASRLAAYYEQIIRP
jgi:hypothetical protein